MIARNSVINKLDWAERSLDAVNRRILTICKWSCIVLLAAMLLIEMLAVFSRYVLNNALPWPEEIAKWLMIWLTFLGSPIALRLGAHAAIEVISSALRGRAHQLLLVIVNVLIIFFLLVLVKEGLQISWMARIQVGSATKISYLYTYIAIPIGSLFMLSVTSQILVRACRGVLVPKYDVSRRDHGAAPESPPASNESKRPNTKR